MSILSVATAFGALSLGLWSRVQKPIIEDSYTCTHQYTTEILSTDPMMLYANNFINPYEIDYLLSHFTNWTYRPGLPPVGEDRSGYRTSSYTILPVESSDKVISCIAERADIFSGFIPSDGIEAMQIGRTQQGEEHPLHVDYIIDPESEDADIVDGKICNRAASFFVFMSDVENGGETYFPYLDAPPENLFVNGTKFKRPKSKDALGMMIKPVKGNAVFWMNRLRNGTMDDRTLHAGMKVIKGTKYGLNVLVQQCA